MSKGDALVYDMSQSSEGSSSVFVKRDWLNILDNQNGNYQGNQVVLDTSQLANSNKYMAYREAYLSIPLIMTATSGVNGAATASMLPASQSVDYAFGLKNWFGSIVHSMTLDLAGTTIVQQTPLCSLWQSFVLMTTLSLNDVATNGAQMGFYPDDPLAWGFIPTGATQAGQGVCSSSNAESLSQDMSVFTTYRRYNKGFLERQRYFALDPAGAPGGLSGGATFSQVLTTQSMNSLYKSYIFNKVDANGTNYSVIQYQIQATLQLKHIHNFFQQIPLLKGLFLRMTLNVNQPTAVIGVGAGNALTINSVTTPLGGVSPIMVASADNLPTGYIYTTNAVDGAGAGATVSAVVPNGSANFQQQDTVTVSLAVGNKVLNTAQVNLAGVQATSALNQSVFLYVPAYTFNPTFEEAYLASPTKQIVYTDIYQFPTATVSSGSQFNFLITNGIANIKSVLVLPFFTASGASTVRPIASPFDPAGAGPTSPMALISNFNITVAGQNMIYNTQRYAFEQFMNQLQGCNAVNADLVDGLTSSLVDKLGFEQEYCYYYVDCSRMLPVDEAVPKSVQITGTNMSTQSVQYITFIEYGVQVGVDVLTGSRV